jgi:hypothetical protein
VKIKLFYILKSKDTLNILGAKNFDDGITSYKLALNIKNLNIELNKFEKVKTELIKKYGKENKDGNTQVLPINKDKYSKELDEILQRETDIDILFLDPSKIVGISPFQILSIEWMIKTEEGKEV